MTTAEFLALPSSEQDAIVAKKVMGISYRWCHGLEGPVCFLTTDTRYGNAMGTERYVSSMNEIPHYSTDIAAAWEVFEKAALNSVFRAETPLYGVGYGNDGKYATALTAPLAICLAALKTKGVISES